MAKDDKTRQKYGASSLTRIDFRNEIAILSISPTKYYLVDRSSPFPPQCHLPAVTRESSPISA